MVVPPYIQTNVNGSAVEEGAIDDFDNLFGEPVPPGQDTKGYGSFLASIEESACESVSKKNIKDILERRPRPISPTLPRMEAALSALKSGPHDILSDDAPDAKPAVPQRSESGKRTATTRTKAALPVPSAKTAGVTRSATLSRKRNSPTASIGMASPMKTPRSSTVGSKATTNPRLRELLRMMEKIQEKEQMNEAIEDWKQMISSLERLETIESAKSPRDLSLLFSCALALAWIAEHLVDVLLKRMQMKTVVSNTPDATLLLSYLAQISALRDQAKHCSLRALSLYGSMDNTDQSRQCLSPYSTLTMLISYTDVINGTS